jgi:hypothetical protein
MEKRWQTPYLMLLVDIRLLFLRPHHGTVLALVPELLPVSPRSHIILILDVVPILLDLVKMGWARSPRESIACIDDLPLHRHLLCVLRLLFLADGLEVSFSPTYGDRFIRRSFLQLK